VFSLAVFLSLPFLPVLGMFLAMLAPLPLVHLVAGGRSSALAWGWVAALLVGAALVTQQVWIVALCVGYLTVTAWPALAVELWVRRPWSSGRWVTALTGGAFAISCIFLVALFYPQQPAERIQAFFTSAMTESRALLEALSPAGRGGEDVLSAAIAATAYLVPAAVATYVAGIGLWLRPRLRLLGIARGTEPFHLLRVEEWLPVGFALGGLGWVFTTGLVKWLAANLLVTVLGLYLLQGVAIIHFYLGRRLGSNRWVRVAVMLFALQLPVAVLLVLAGLADAFFPLRRGAGWDGGSGS